MCDDVSQSRLKFEGIPVKVMSFDLDDTLWHAAPALDQAEVDLMTHLHTHKPHIGSLIQTRFGTVRHLMNQIHRGIPISPHQHTHTHTHIHSNAHHIQLDAHAYKKHAYSHPKNSKHYCVNFTMLRKQALMQAAALASSHLSNEEVDDAYNTWYKARVAVEPYIHPSVHETLLYLRQNGVLVGAITNGNANISDVPSLKSLFDFYVNAEIAQASKPHPQIFETAFLMADIYKKHKILKEHWVHVGDDPLEDIFAANCAGVRTIWTYGLWRNRCNETNPPHPPDVTELKSEYFERLKQEIPNLIGEELKFSNAKVEFVVDVRKLLEPV